jgi:hypothetical protein
MPNRWLAVTVLYVGSSCLVGLLNFLFAWRKLRRRLTAAPYVPRDALEVKRHGVHLREVCGLVFAVTFLLGAGWFWSAVADLPFGWGLFFAATLLGVNAVTDLVIRWTVLRWERRHGRILTSLLLGAGDVFYVERGVRPA